MSEIQLTDKERAAIRDLKALAKRWPKSLWLFSASGTLCVMRMNADGERAHGGGRDGCGVDPAYTVDTIKGIPNDGGDW